MANRPILKVGCSGFGMAQKSYMQTFQTVEVQQTFYEPPRTSTMQKWREAAPSSFDFAIKAWQLITHTSSSPTYRRLKKALTPTEAKESGSFRQTSIVDEAWAATLERALILKASHILFQCPGSFAPSKENISNLRKFFSSIERPENMLMCFEPRGNDWSAKVVAQLCSELELIHVVDPFVNKTVTREKFYYRMHGVSGWRHIYSDDELKELKKLIPKGKSGRVYFNNISMVQDALRFSALY